ncbi:hypothetical protein LTS00_001473 [Friedmanniomyces endolithicus]|uniref:SnoaL-like domain-containing protein n=3 Tax=Friedmanniomyces endolithicus TaxID=329885 RepID=A0AAN6J303_9PEZI|nr:hypothetical protein LTS00_001473 [Friedmanniomyces endolithicus]KAK0313084.1 hypothetical protein LTR82_013701 [Friedmanniomyces endolithicus]
MSVAKRLDIAVACHSLEERGYGIQDLIQSQSGCRRLKMTTSHQHLPPTQTPSSINRRSPTATMSTDSTAATMVARMRRFVIEIQQNGNFDLIDELTHPDFFDHTAAPGQSPHRDGVHAIMRYIHSTISEIKIEIIHSISDGKIVATTKVLRGKQVGDIFGKPATDKMVEMRIADFLTSEDGKFKDHWATISAVQDL